MKRHSQDVPDKFYLNLRLQLLTLGGAGFRSNQLWMIAESNIAVNCIVNDVLTPEYYLLCFFRVGNSQKFEYNNVFL